MALCDVHGILPLFFTAAAPLFAANKKAESPDRDILRQLGIFCNEKIRNFPSLPRGRFGFIGNA
jgi:hypothetical protein